MTTHLCGGELLSQVLLGCLSSLEVACQDPYLLPPRLHVSLQLCRVGTWYEWMGELAAHNARRWDEDHDLT